MHICVCICTYKRPRYLKRHLHGLSCQDAQGSFTFSIVIVDNDAFRSSEGLVTEFARSSAINIRYFVETRQNISLARNLAVGNAAGDYVAFIDDDEFPTEAWLL